ncbi:hypothetical protein AAFM79_10500 [Trichormus azollae HNT15244]
MLDIDNSVKPLAVKSKPRKTKSRKTLNFDIIPAYRKMPFFTHQDLFVKIDKGSARLGDTINTFRNKYD